ncbi:allose kinase [Avibacterium sp. 21-599]|uniref:allose kinase n=1 Tax=Avibacterium sp. 21-599 TaxID=2911528 RepID=UPI002246B30A|nr:allose kinase [Avibacterium sp. 21-599]MCW9719060.1 allose kinase [Avibacterium sp. 21-599]
MGKPSIVIGIDMGATHIRICLMTLAKKIILTEKRRTKDIIKHDLTQGIRQFINQHCEKYHIKHIVIGLPAAVSKDRTQVLSVPNIDVNPLQFKQLIPVISQYFNCPVQLERDVNLQLLYDIHHFKLQNKAVLGIYLGTGLGFSIYQQDKLFIGQHGVAGELGHIPYGNSNKQCQCGNYGCLETICSGRTLKEWYDSSPKSFPFSQIFTQAKEDEFIKSFLHHLAKAIAMAANLFDPDCIILGGGVMDMSDFPYQVLQKDSLMMIRKPLPYDKIHFYPAQSSDFNGAIGAALQAIYGEAL